MLCKYLLFAKSAKSQMPVTRRNANYYSTTAKMGGF